MRWRLPALALSVRLTDHERLSVSSTSVSRITGLDTYDIRFPTSRELDGSDAMNTDPDYSAAYLVLRTDSEDGLEGHGFAFTIGRGNDVQVAALDVLRAHVVGRSVEDLCDDPGSLARDLTGDSQLRWLGPEKGVMHMAVGAVINAVWDLAAKRADKPLWKFLADADPEWLADQIDYRYITDALTRQEAVTILQRGREGRTARESDLLAHGYPACTTSPGWLGYTDEKLTRLAQRAVADGFRQIKLKVGADLDDDIRRFRAARTAVGPASASPWTPTSAGTSTKPSPGPPRWPILTPTLVQQRQQLCDVVAVSAGQRDCERDALSVGEDVVLAARPCTVDRAGPAFGPRRAARTWEESITARDQSSFFAARSFLSSTRCSSSHTPASFHAARRRQHVIPDPKAQLLRQVLPLDTGVQHEQDPAQHLPVRHPRPALHQLRTRLGQQRFDERPQFIRHDPWPRLSFPHERGEGRGRRTGSCRSGADNARIVP
ncbi:putative putative racemase [Streptomyces scabiei 87.22]|uniref:Racemase n=2 Tax=Streptomyces TaxID=1883 RepID=M3FV04_9ACTN|nr:racemase [Streptomyces bottropensis ATCC 25435]CBG67282.1 putative putative racemase [Streptomyces scabiei 87.22]